MLRRQHLFGPSRRRESGQSAVETLFMIPILLLVFMGMFELFTITFAAQNAHIRAREYVLHNGQYTPSRPAGEPLGSNGSVFGGGNYIIADPDIWGVASKFGGGSMQKGWKASAHDQGIPGISTESDADGTYIKATAYICSPVGCPDPVFSRP